MTKTSINVVQLKVATLPWAEAAIPFSPRGGEKVIGLHQSNGKEEGTGKK